MSEQIVKQELFCSTSDQLSTVPSYFGPASVLEGIQVVRSVAEFRVFPNLLSDELGNNLIDETGDYFTDYSLSNLLIDEAGNYLVDELGNNLNG